ncbi:MAG: inositol/phosphatidylinositol phosphatase [Amphiamblys sp. WSBS2006]|nr:MAG: inositol/phosphatidylinositol phosphatase [Amphiamblys sp. WSBS2006]
MDETGERKPLFALSETEDCYTIQPRGENTALVVEKKTGELRVENKEPLSGSPLYGLVGLIDLVSGPFLILATDAVVAGDIDSNAVFLLTKTEIVPCCRENKTSEDDECIESLLSYLNTPGFYFSYTYDLLTNTQTRNRKNTEWCVNDFVQTKIKEHTYINTKTHRFLFPLIQGSFETSNNALGNKLQIDFALISRRSKNRQGTRYHTRGIDSDSNVANYVETEQLVFFSQNVSSFLQLRGSAPFFWTQTVDLQYKPRLTILRRHETGRVFENHFEKIRQNYGDVTVLDLVDGRGYEKPLRDTFSDLCSRYNEKHIQLDFHGEAKKDIEQKIIHSVKKMILLYEYAQHGDETPKTQLGVIRTNCVDCLDRTNVAQTIIGWEVAQWMVSTHSLPEKDRAAFETTVKESFKRMWIANGNRLSLEYAGTGALKTDYAELGRRTKRGIWNDMLGAGERYFRNNFLDYKKQEGADLFLGVCPVKRSESPFVAHHSRSSGFLLLLFLIAALLLRDRPLLLIAFALDLAVTLLAGGRLYANHARLYRTASFVPRYILENNFSKDSTSQKAFPSE